VNFSKAAASNPELVVQAETEDVKAVIEMTSHGTEADNFRVEYILASRVDVEVFGFCGPRLSERRLYATACGCFYEILCSPWRISCRGRSDVAALTVLRSRIH
jgi:hypothetical protein